MFGNKLLYKHTSSALEVTINKGTGNSNIQASNNFQFKGVFTLYLQELWVGLIYFSPD